MGDVLRGMAGYLMLVVGVRFVGRRLGAQITPFDTVVIFFLGGTVLSPVLGDERSIANAMLTCFGVALVYVAIGWLKQVSPRCASFFDGTPLVLMEAGCWTPEVLNRMGLNNADVMAAARAVGITTLDQIDYAVLERNGQINVVQVKSRR